MYAAVSSQKQFTEILVRKVSVYAYNNKHQFTEIFQKFHGAPTMSIYRDFMVPRLRQFTEILCAPTMSIYRYFMVSRLRQFTEFFVVPRLCQFIGISHDQVKPVKSS